MEKEKKGRNREEKAKFCGQCGKRIPEGAVICPFCKRRIGEETTVPFILYVISR